MITHDLGFCRWYLRIDLCLLCICVDSFTGVCDYKSRHFFMDQSILNILYTYWIMPPHLSVAALSLDTSLEDNYGYPISATVKILLPNLSSIISGQLVCFSASDVSMQMESCLQLRNQLNIWKLWCWFWYRRALFCVLWKIPLFNKKWGRDLWPHKTINQLYCSRSACKKNYPPLSF